MWKYLKVQYHQRPLDAIIVIMVQSVINFDTLITELVVIFGYYCTEAQSSLM